MFPNKTLLAGALLVCAIAAAARAALITVVGSPIVWNTGTGHNNHTYYLLSPGTWTDSEAFAVSNLGGHLVTVDDANEENFIINNYTSVANANRVLWIGLSDQTTEGTFQWADGTPFNGASYGHTLGSFPWYSGEPNNATDSGGGPGGEDYISFNWHYTVPDAIGVYQTIHGTWNDDINTGPTSAVAPRHGGALGPFNGLVEVVVPEPLSLALAPLAAMIVIRRKRSA
jgi:hypothetical protein